MSTTTLENIATFLYEKCHDRGMSTTSIVVALSEFLGVVVPMGMEGKIREYRRGFTGLEKLAGEVLQLLVPVVHYRKEFKSKDELLGKKAVIYFWDGAELANLHRHILWDGNKGITMQQGSGQCLYINSIDALWDHIDGETYYYSDLHTDNYDSAHWGNVYVLHKMDSDIPVHTYSIVGDDGLMVLVDIYKVNNLGVLIKQDFALNIGDIRAVFSKGSLYRIA